MTIGDRIMFGAVGLIFIVCSLVLTLAWIGAVVYDGVPRTAEAWVWAIAAPLLSVLGLTVGFTLTADAFRRR